MWTGKLTGSEATSRGLERAPDVEKVRQVQQSLWYVLTMIAVAEMIFGAWAVGLLR